VWLAASTLLDREGARAQAPAPAPQRQGQAFDEQFENAEAPSDLMLNGK
jgi:hypothetical protein